MAAAAYPHYTLEDTKITYNDLVRIFDIVPAIATSCRTDLRALTHWRTAEIARDLSARER